jgi:hypothetical protein
MKKNHVLFFGGDVINFASVAAGSKNESARRLRACGPTIRPLTKLFHFGTVTKVRAPENMSETRRLAATV